MNANYTCKLTNHTIILFVLLAWKPRHHWAPTPNPETAGVFAFALTLRPTAGQPPSPLALPPEHLQDLPQPALPWCPRPVSCHLCHRIVMAAGWSSCLQPFLSISCHGSSTLRPWVAPPTSWRTKQPLSTTSKTVTHLCARFLRPLTRGLANHGPWHVIFVCKEKKRLGCTRSETVP